MVKISYDAEKGKKVIQSLPEGILVKLRRVMEACLKIVELSRSGQRARSNR